MSGSKNQPKGGARGGAPKGVRQKAAVVVLGRRSRATRPKRGQNAEGRGSDRWRRSRCRLARGNAAAAKALPRRGRAKLREEFGYTNPMQVRSWTRSSSTWALVRPPRIRRSSTPRSANSPRSPGRSGQDIGKEGDRRVQNSERSADRLQGDIAQGTHVRISRPADHHCDAARARFSRHHRQGLRRAGNFAMG